MTGAAASRRLLHLRTLSPCLPPSAFDQHYAGSSTTVNLQASLLARIHRIVEAEYAAAETAYELSLPMLCASILGPSNWSGTTSLATMREQCLLKLGEERGDDAAALARANWILGRVVLAAAGQPQHGPLTAKLSDELHKLGPTTRCWPTAWAWSYYMLAVSRSEPAGSPAFEDLRPRWEEAVEAAGLNDDDDDIAAAARSSRGGVATTLADFDRASWAWSHICALSVAGQAGDEPLYFRLCEELHDAASPGGASADDDTDDTDAEDDTGAALAAKRAAESLGFHVPASDFRAWGTSLVVLAAAQIGARPGLVCGDAQQHALLTDAAAGPCERVLALSTFQYAQYISDSLRRHAAHQIAQVGDDRSGSGHGVAADGGGARSKDWKLSVPGTTAGLAVLRGFAASP